MPRLGLPFSRRLEASGCQKKFSFRRSGLYQLMRLERISTKPIEHTYPVPINMIPRMMAMTLMTSLTLNVEELISRLRAKLNTGI